MVFFKKKKKAKFEEFTEQVEKLKKEKEKIADELSSLEKGTYYYKKGIKYKLNNEKRLSVDLERIVFQENIYYTDWRDMYSISLKEGYKLLLALEDIYSVDFNKDQE